jgi:predicted DNA binding CopG/RHH family protein
MKDQDNFSTIKGSKATYTKSLKQSVMMRLDNDAVSYFKSMSDETGIPFQTLINLYLCDCASNQRKLRMKWQPENE